ncbi:DNA-binding Lrp family transcriptional regulator [Catenulispora sp. GP43]|uniref:MarR family transcriptional regulator n=1 Tax=Catenulispora sp. GP43 TaxID=3156263 RepID=UPI0035155606
MGETENNGSWTILTAHGRALVEIVARPDIRMRDLAEAIGVVERTAQAIVADLEQAGYVTHERVGRRNRYSVDLDQPFRHRAQRGHHVGPFLAMLSSLPEVTDSAAAGNSA